MAFPTTQDGGPARGCAARARLDAPGTVHHVIFRGMEHGQMVAGREDHESFPARLGLSPAGTGRLLGISTSGIAAAVERAERREAR